MDKKKVKLCLKSLGYAVMQILLSRINLFGFFSPVGLPFAFVRMFYGGNIFVTTLSYLVSRIYLFSNLNALVITIYEVVLLTLYYFAIEFFKTKRKVLLLYCFMLVSNALGFYFNIFSVTTLWHFAVNLAAQAFFVFYFYKLFQVYKNKFIFFRFSHKDYVFFSTAILMLSIGLFQYNFMLKILGLFLVSVSLVYLCRILPIDKYFIFSCIFSIGAMIASGSYFYMVFSCLCSIILIQFRELNKYLYAAVCFSIFAIISLAFKLFDALSLVSLSLSVLCFVATPGKIISKLKSLFDIQNENLLSKQLEVSKTQVIQNKLFLMSNILSSMQNNFKYMLIGKIDRGKACNELANDIILKCCNNCESYKTCFLGTIDKKTMISNLMSKAVEKSGLDMQDLTNGMIAYCSKSRILVSEINQMSTLFLSYEKSVKTEDSSKLMIASEIQNFSDIFLNFAKMIENSSKINQNSSKMLKEALLGQMIESKEVAVLEDENGIKSVNIILSNEQALRREIIETIFKVTKVKVKSQSVKHMEYSGIAHVTYVPVTKFKAEFAYASKSKETKNGDNIMITKLGDNKFFVAIADGMGHGEKANKLSAMVLSLIRSLFEVGLDEKLIISSVNKLLLPVGLDNFTTLDCCVLDLEKNVCNFIKLGASVSVIKRKNTSEIVSCESLPIGIVQNIKPTIVSKQISCGDMIFLASDGVVDSFENLDIYKSFINDAKIYNMQKYLDEVINDASVQNKNHPDDMTIIGINLLKN